MHKCTNVLTRWLVLSLAHWIECIVLFMITIELYRIQKVKMHIKSNKLLLCRRWCTANSTHFTRRQPFISTLATCTLFICYTIYLSLDSHDVVFIWWSGIEKGASDHQTLVSLNGRTRSFIYTTESKLKGAFNQVSTSLNFQKFLQPKTHPVFTNWSDEFHFCAIIMWYCSFSFLVSHYCWCTISLSLAPLFAGIKIHQKW